MKAFFEEYGKIVLAGAVAVLLMVLLLGSGGLMDAFDGFRPKSPEVKNEVVKGQLASLSSRTDPVLVLKDPLLKTGEKVFIWELVQEAKACDGTDLKGNVRYYLEDGTRVGSGYVVTADRETTLRFRMYVEDAKGRYTEKTLVLTITQENPGAGSSEEEVEKWDIGVTPGTVWARILTREENGEKKTLLSITGEGMAGYFEQSAIPWRAYRQELAACEIASKVSTRDVSYWFQDCRKLLRVPEFSGASVLVGTFQNCTSLKYGSIPMEANNITSMYEGCTGIQRISEVPAYVTQMSRAFYGCSSLRGSMRVKAEPWSYGDCFGLVGSKTEGISLKVYGTSRNEATVKGMVQQEYGQNRGSNLSYAGTVTG